MNRLSYFRKARGLTVGQAARMAYLSEDQYIRYEEGKQLPNVWHGQLIARALGTTVEQLWR
ncbi:MAG TPA: helix-turn-helix domain-containing protein [Firmicutes bacterium]|nr:helix-turn-helix domain-containing protein [Bacillota bacterium]